jgi:hypothetical protein
MLRNVQLLGKSRQIYKFHHHHGMLVTRSYHASPCVSFLSDTEIDQSLRNDIKTLGSILGECIKGENAEDFEAVETMRKLGRHVRLHLSNHN